LKRNLVKIVKYLSISLTGIESFTEKYLQFSDERSIVFQLQICVLGVGSRGGSVFVMREVSTRGYVTQLESL